MTAEQFDIGCNRTTIVADARRQKHGIQRISIPLHRKISALLPRPLFRIRAMAPAARRLCANPRRSETVAAICASREEPDTPQPVGGDFIAVRSCISFLPEVFLLSELLSEMTERRVRKIQCRTIRPDHTRWIMTFNDFTDLRHADIGGAGQRMESGDTLRRQREQ